MGRLRAGFGDGESSSSSDDEDAFASMSRKRKRKSNKSGGKQLKKDCSNISNSNKISNISNSSSNKDSKDSSNDDKGKKNKGETINSKPPPTSAMTSSMKRHHNVSDQRKARMDALLLELEAQKDKQPPTDGFVPAKKGSFVEHGQEHITTNIFVGNLDPTITEEQLTELFVQFGELHSVKIMWPRTQAERMRNRNTGFVCFRKREDAEVAMDSCSETDPFNVGRRLMLRWGKDIKNKVQRGAAATLNIGRRDRKDLTSSRPDSKPKEDKDAVKQPTANTTASASVASVTTPDKPLPEQKAKNEVKVEAPPDPARCRFITTVATFVAADGSLLENRLIQKYVEDERFSFLFPPKDSSDKDAMTEHVFYRWRVFSLCQNDSVAEWKLKPFQMLQSVGLSYVPPAVETVGGLTEIDAGVPKPTVERVKFITGRQLERARANRVYYRSGQKTDGSEQLTPEDVQEFDRLSKSELSISRAAICRAMAFCFERGYAARDIADRLRQLLVDNGPNISVDTKVARLFLISDILFNSQQPGVRNAFLYRDAVEKMAPDVFTSFGTYGGVEIGRLSKNKLRRAVMGVLGAWTEWSVYSPNFMDELQDRFEGKPVSGGTMKKDDDRAAVDTASANQSDHDSQASTPPQDTQFDTQARNTNGLEDNKTVQPDRVPRPFVSEPHLGRSRRPSCDDDMAGGESVIPDDIDGEPLEDGDLPDDLIFSDDEVDGNRTPSDIDGEELDD